MADVPISRATFERPSWGERKFSFVHPPWMLADFIERLRGAVPRLRALVLDVNETDAHRQVDGRWSIAQNIGHLADVEELWQERLDDLRSGRKTYTPAVPARFQELAKRHQAIPIEDTIGELEDRRTILVDALANASPELQQASAFHERLQVPMRLVDCSQFYAEHDDHHLLRIRELRSHFTHPDSETTEGTHPNRDAFVPGLSGPALRALDTAGIRSMRDLESWTERDLAKLHGMGPKGVRMLREALAASGRAFRQR
jgi:uncharacterized damage-inducible protein DinB